MPRALQSLALATILAAPPAAFAHEGHAHHLMGTVASVSHDGKTLEVKEKDGRTVRVALTSETKILKGEKSVAASDLRSGARVVVTTKETEGAPPTALEIRMAESETTSPQSSYTCPMHPEVRAVAAGKCSKCGMDLEKAG